MGNRVMIVDDATFMRMMLKDILVNNDYEVVAEAENGLRAIDAYKEHKPDLVLLDITMPEMDGIEALRKIKEIDADSKVIMCSAMGQQTMVMDAIQAGALDFIVKPFDKDRVVGACQKVLG